MTPTVYQAPREWTRLHPVSPFLGAWSVFGAIGAYWFFNNAPEWAGGAGEAAEGTWHPAIITLAIIGLVIALFVVAGGYLAWRMTTFRITDDSVELRKGILFRQNKQARLDRLQAVDVVQPLLARIFRFASVRIEVAGGEGSTVALEYLRLGDAEALRNEIMVLAAGLKTGRPAAAEGEAPSAGSAQEPSLRDVLRPDEQAVPAIAAAEERDVLSVPLGRLVASIALSGPFLWLVGLPLAGLVVILAVSSEVETALLGIIGGSIAGFLPLVFAIVGYVWTRLTGGFGFVAGISADGVRLRHGMLETRRQTVPPGRVQAVKLRQPLLWRGRDWWRITINVAGYQAGETAVSTLLPVGTRADALAALWLVLPDLGDPDPEGTISRAMSGRGADGGFVASPRSARWFDPMQWKNRGVRATETALLIREGALVRELSIVPHERTQSLGLSQGPLERAAGVASVIIHSTPGPVMPAAHHLAVEDAFRLIEEQAIRAREGRRKQTPEQWLAAVAPAIDDVLASDDITAAPESDVAPTLLPADAPRAPLPADAPGAPVPTDGSTATADRVEQAPHSPTPPERRDV
ncbi:PH domain-containing protein [Demequina zhanjiangensis]|uniref:PH domain-containing protein n=1 Tax=Demequina zhanjiangensis TaxID=3051659 RepID=A0ABT8FYK2_9MICO|nr:PH domain-containing protein [Demequina sp. SYSU T00b26]MDN4471989.1 PH domain-containing protein [Demequina sp. SYSU T00b26]